MVYFAKRSPLNFLYLHKIRYNVTYIGRFSQDKGPSNAHFREEGFARVD
ncbi:hypothetical protein VCHA43P273_10044 [Vibrio chagasii]|nr:hypothetical protein VCHA43P273_10044 [Vibrio chagasii]